MISHVDATDSQGCKLCLYSTSLVLGCVKSPGVYICRGDNVPGGVFPAKSRQECAKACWENPLCRFWTLRTTDNYCWLKVSDKCKGGPNDNWITGTKTCGSTENILDTEMPPEANAEGESCRIVASGPFGGSASKEVLFNDRIVASNGKITQIAFRNGSWIDQIQVSWLKRKQIHVSAGNLRQHWVSSSRWSRWRACRTLCSARFRYRKSWGKSHLYFSVDMQNLFFRALSSQELLNLTFKASRSSIRAREGTGLLDVQIVPLEENLRLPRTTVSFVTSQAPRQAVIRRLLLATLWTSSHSTGAVNDLFTYIQIGGHPKGLSALFVLQRKWIDGKTDLLFEFWIF